jgi:hypothetical protein
MPGLNHGLFVWGSTFVVVAGGGLALAGDGDRQERAVYGAGIGGAVGAALGLAVEAVRTGGDGSHLLSGALIGAGAGVLLGGVYGALSHDGDEDISAVPLLSFRFRL